MEIISSSVEQTQSLGEDFAKNLKPGDVVAFFGDLGSGKTTFIQGVMKGLGVEQRITSPTFVMLKMYHTPEKTTIFHLDLYRTESADDIKSLGLTDILGNQQTIVLIEWAEKMENMLPESTIELHFEQQEENTRKIYGDRL